jgi:hypothetical protein
MWIQGCDPTACRRCAGEASREIVERPRAAENAIPQRLASRLAKGRRPRKAVSTHVALCAALVLFASSPVEPVRWWRCAPLVAALRVTPDQRRAIERVYETRLPQMTDASVDVIQLTDRVAEKLREDQYDEELLVLTDRLVHARRTQVDWRDQMLALSANTLSIDQRDLLARLIRERRIMD